MAVRLQWFSKRALRLHGALLFVVAACLALGWWQLSRALSGNGLSWVYTFEWPFFAAYAVYMWWKLLHEPLTDTRAGELESRRAARPPGEEIAEVLGSLDFDPYDETDLELAAYNRYLANLHAGDRSGAPGRRSRGQA